MIHIDSGVVNNVAPAYMSDQSALIDHHEACSISRIRNGGVDDFYFIFGDDWIGYLFYTFCFKLILIQGSQICILLVYTL